MGARRGSKGSNQTPNRVSASRGVCWMAWATKPAAAVGGGAQHVAPQQGTGDDGPEDVPGTGEAAVNVEMAHHKGLVPGAGASPTNLPMGRPR